MNAQIDKKAHGDIWEKLGELYWGLFEHDGYGEVKVEMKILRRGQKEIILHCGKQYRFVVDGPASLQPSDWEKAKSILMTELIKAD